jgi:hypothetical protein
LIKDAPPQGGGVIIGQGSCGGRRPDEPGSVEAGPGEIGQPFCQFRQEWVRGHAWGFGGEQLPPSPIGIRSSSGESLVELLLEDSVDAAELGCT